MNEVPPFLENEIKFLINAIPLYTKHHNIDQKCEIKTSTIHGNGIFANCDILEGEIITLYPVHGVCVCPSGERGDHARLGMVGAFDIFNNIQYRNPTIEDYHVYGMNHSKYIFTIGYPEITNGFIGHIANDGVKVKTNVFNPRQKQIYLNCASERNNARFLRLNDENLHKGLKGIGQYITSVTATKNISQGEEILVTYGYEYWVNKSHT